jgi:hypothetical protein
MSSRKSSPKSSSPKSSSPTQIHNLPPDTLRNILGRLRLANSASLASTSKNNKLALEYGPHSMKDYVQKVAVPYAETILKKFKTYAQTQKYIKDMYPLELTKNKFKRPTAKASVKNIMNNPDLFTGDEKELKRISKIMGLSDRNVQTVISMIDNAVKEGIKYSNYEKEGYERIPHPLNISTNRNILKNVTTMQELTSMITFRVGNEFRDQYNTVYHKIIGTRIQHRNVNI